MMTGQGWGMGTDGCNKLCPVATGHSWVECFPSVSIKDRSLHGPWPSHRFIIPSTYLIMGAGRLVTLLSWTPALSGLTDWRRG
jgi:hypothetical protein